MEAISGDYTLNPLYFNNSTLSNVYISVNGTSLFNIACDFPHKCSKLYYTVLNAIGFNVDNILTYESFVKGQTLLAFNLLPEEIKDTVSLEATGNLRITLEFNTALVGNKVVLLFGPTTGVMKINADRRIICETRA